jgi:hypothetical protein
MSTPLMIAGITFGKTRRPLGEGVANRFRVKVPIALASSPKPAAYLRKPANGYSNLEARRPPSSFFSVLV